MTLDEYNKLRLLYVYYATANRNAHEVFAWQDICILLMIEEFLKKTCINQKKI